MKSMRTFALALAAPLLLLSCFFAPGEFDSALDIRQDRSFRFAYDGEVILNRPEGGELDLSGVEEAGGEPDGETASAASLTEAQAEAIVEALRKEAGYRSVAYLGENRFRVDYEIAGRLDHNFVYPLNIDASAVLPWIAVEVRQDGSARVTGLAFGGDETGGMSGPGAGTDPNRFRNGTFTLTTDAEVVMHNSETGVTPGPERRIVWTVTPATRNAPTAVVAFSR